MVNEEELQELKDLGASDIEIKSVTLGFMDANAVKERLIEENKYKFSKDISINNRLKVISSTEKKLYYLVKYSNTEWLYIKKETYAKKLKVTADEIKKALDNLVKAELLIIDYRKSTKGNYSYKVYKAVEEKIESNFDDLW